MKYCTTECLNKINSLILMVSFMMISFVETHEASPYNHTRSDRGEKISELDTPKLQSSAGNIRQKRGCADDGVKWFICPTGHGSQFSVPPQCRNQSISDGHGNV